MKLLTIEELADNINATTDRLNFWNEQFQQALAERKRKDEEASKALLKAVFGEVPVFTSVTRTVEKEYPGIPLSDTAAIIEAVAEPVGKFGFAKMTVKFGPRTPEERIAYEQELRNSPKAVMSTQEFYEEADATLVEIQNVVLGTPEAVKAFRQHFLGRRGRIADLFDNLRFIDASKRRDYGVWLNEIKTQAQATYGEALRELGQ